MLCYVVLCYDIHCKLCYVILCMLCFAMFCYAMLCYVMLCYVMLCYAMLCYFMLCYVMVSCVCYVMLRMLCYAMSKQKDLLLSIFPHDFVVQLLHGGARRVACRQGLVVALQTQKDDTRRDAPGGVTCYYLSLSWVVPSIHTREGMQIA